MLGFLIPLMIVAKYYASTTLVYDSLYSCQFICLLDIVRSYVIAKSWIILFFLATQMY